MRAKTLRYITWDDLRKDLEDYGCPPEKAHSLVERLSYRVWTNTKNHYVPTSVVRSECEEEISGTDGDRQLMKDLGQLDLVDHLSEELDDLAEFLDWLKGLPDDIHIETGKGKE